jgi:hypothetical protein
MSVHIVEMKQLAVSRYSFKSSLIIALSWH